MPRPNGYQSSRCSSLKHRRLFDTSTSDNAHVVKYCVSSAYASRTWLKQNIMPFAQARRRNDEMASEIMAKVHGVVLKLIILINQIL